MQEENVISLRAAFTLATQSKAKSIYIYIDPLKDLVYPKPIPRGLQIVLFTKKKRWDFSDVEKKSLAGRAHKIVTLPKIAMTRVSMIKLALMLAMSDGEMDTEHPIVCVAGLENRGRLDTIQCLDPSKETELLTVRAGSRIGERVSPPVFQSVLNLAMELAEKGREGKPIGTTFVVGDAERVMQLSKQMIINPFKGYDEEERNIVSPALKETIREFSSLDGAFVLDGEGVVLTAGRYLGAASDGSQLPQGLGSRHIAAAGITALTDAIAFVISESSGDLRIFKNGKIIMEVEKSQKL